MAKDKLLTWDIFQQLSTNVSQKIISNIPELKRIGNDVTESIFVPKAILRQLMLAIMLETGIVTVNQMLSLAQWLLCKFSSRSRAIRQLEGAQRSSQSQQEWTELAEQIDHIQLNDAWREDPNCLLYEQDRISSRMDEFVHLMRRGDIFELMFTLRGGIARNKYGLLHEGLFRKALCGPKMLVENYHNLVCSSLDFVCDGPVLKDDGPIPTDAKLAFFNEVRHAYGRTALMLSGGAALGFYHVGVAKTLMENRLLPRVLSGSSAGSLVCAMFGTRTDEECQDMFSFRGTIAEGHSGKLMTNFFRPMETSQQKLGTDSLLLGGNQIKEVRNDQKKTWNFFFPTRIRRLASLIYDILSGHRRAKDMMMNDTEHFRHCVRNNVGNFTFQEAFDRTGRIVNIIVTPQNHSDPPRLLNYLTAPHVLIWSAVVASSSLPGIFEPNKLYVKEADGTERNESSTMVALFKDGSMEQDLPMQQLSEMFNVNHFIISQANPHAVLLATFNLTPSVWNSRVLGFCHGVLQFLKKQVKSWISNTIELIGGQRIAPLWDTRRGLFSQVFTQEYQGREIDISLVPWAGHRSVFSALLHCLHNPTEKDFREWIHAAEKETWRQLPKIKNHVAEEMTLDLCVQRLRKKIMSESRSKEKGITEKINTRVPSFYTSSSLANLSGLGITDQFLVDKDKATKQNEEYGSGPVFIQSNYSSGYLNKYTSGGSGLFLIDGETEDEKMDLSSDYKNIGKTDRVIKDTMEKNVPEGRNNEYLKTASMSNFYYRKIKSNNSLHQKI